MKKVLFFIICILLIPMKIFAFDLGKSAILMEEDTKRILFSKNINEKMLIASTTKIMTAVVAIESGKLNNYVTVNDKILDSYGSSIYLSIGEKMKLEDMVYGLMLRSGNDAAVMISEFLGGERKFVNKMNMLAKKIGMKNTIFSNPSGLDEKTKNYSTAYDMALLMRYANSYSIFKKIIGSKNYKVTTNKKSYYWVNKNKLLFTYKYTTGGKTGFTEKARRTLVTSASNNNLDLIVVTLNDSNDFNNHKKLYEYGFKNYKMIKVFDKDNLNLNNKKIYAKDDYYYPITKDEKSLINYKYKIRINKKNKTAGFVNIMLGNKKIHKEKLYIK